MVERQEGEAARAADEVRLARESRPEIPDLGKRGDEIGDLSDALRSMTEALWQRLNAIESFAADVAHELKNPLTSLRSAIEVAARPNLEPAQREKLMGIVLDDINRLNRLISDISDASRLDAELMRIAPAFPWKPFLDAAGLGNATTLIVGEPTAITRIAEIFTLTPKETVQAWLAEEDGGPEALAEVTLYPAVPMSLQKVADVERAQMLIESPSLKHLHRVLARLHTVLHTLRSAPEHRGLISWLVSALLLGPRQ